MTLTATRLPETAAIKRLQKRLRNLPKKATKAERLAVAEKFHAEHPELKAALELRKATGAAIGKPIPPGWRKVQVFPAGSKVLVKSPDGSIYSDEHCAAADAAKFERIAAFDKALPKIEAGIAAGVAAGVEEAFIVRLILLTAFRRGSHADTGAKVKAYGASTLLASHIKVEGDTVHFDFIGKKGVRQQHAVTDAALAADMLRRLANTAPDAEIFSTTETRLLAWMKQFGDFKLHDIRTWNATAMARIEIEKRTAPASEEAFWNVRDEIGAVVATKLGNRPEESLGTYIDPAVWLNWKTELNITNEERPKQTKSKAA